jgi:glycerophosphoryl diester phosphodiesterase
VRRLLGLLALALAGCSSGDQSPFVEWLPADRAVVVAHRGGADLAPENTLSAMHNAAGPDIEAEVIEIDLHRTSDGVIVVIHDATVDRVTGEGNGCEIDSDSAAGTNGTRFIHEMTLAEIQALDAGFCFTDLDGATSFRDTGVVIPTLRDVLLDLPGQRFALELKELEPSLVEAVTDLVSELSAFERTCFLTFDDQEIADLREAIPPVGCVSMSAAGSRCFAGEDLLPFGGVPCDIGDLAVVPHESAPFDLKRRRFVANMQSYGMPVFMFTVNDADTMVRALNVGINGVITDRPDIARALIGPITPDTTE